MARYERDPQDEADNAMSLDDIRAELEWGDDLEWDSGWGDIRAEDPSADEPEWDSGDSGAYAAQLEAEKEPAFQLDCTTETGFPEGFQGAGPMYAAIPLGEPWLNAATSGATTFVLENPTPAGWTAEEANAEYEAYTGHSAFLDRHQAEALADHPERDGIFVRYEGLTGWNDWTAKADAEFRAAEDAYRASLAQADDRCATCHRDAHRPTTQGHGHHGHPYLEPEAGA